VTRGELGFTLEEAIHVFALKQDADDQVLLHAF
jgi:hypothetical protein